MTAIDDMVRCSAEGKGKGMGVEIFKPKGSQRRTMRFTGVEADKMKEVLASKAKPTKKLREAVEAARQQKN